MLILGIETSCDETAVALVEDGRKILVNLVSSQVAIHREWGGVVPELASRAHLRLLLPLLTEALRAGDRRLRDVGAIAFTRGPGLIGALLVGTSVAKALAYARSLPLLGVHHLKAHVYAPSLEGAALSFPLAALIVSGGHTLLVAAESWEEARVLGQTRDDAAGEAFDKVASLLGLKYPGGPAIDRAASGGDPRRFRFPRGMRGSDDYDFSFSGLKTAVRYLLRDLREKGGGLPIADLAASFQAAVVEILGEKLQRAALAVGARSIVVGGGVARNRALRARVSALFPPPDYRLFIPSPELCSDNAAMIAGLAFRRLERGALDPLDVDADAGFPWGDGLF